MELRELRYFLAVAQKGNITKAAESLYIAQPSLSKQMQNLEKEIGRPLFVRGSRTIVLTETGQLLKKRAEEMLELYEKTEAEIAAPPGEARGEVRIGGGESYALLSVAQAARAVQGDHPAVKFNFFSGDSADVIEKLDKGLLDFGVLIDRTDLSEYVTMRLPACDVWGFSCAGTARSHGMKAFLPSSCGARPSSYPASRGAKGSQLCEWFGGDMGHLNIRAEYNLIYNATLLVRAGMGCARYHRQTYQHLRQRPLLPAAVPQTRDPPGHGVGKNTRSFPAPRRFFWNICGAEPGSARGGNRRKFFHLSPVLYTIPTRMLDDDTDGGKETAASCA